MIYSSATDLMSHKKFIFYLMRSPPPHRCQINFSFLRTLTSNTFTENIPSIQMHIHLENKRGMHIHLENKCGSEDVLIE